jgi:hypothetical protein
MPTFGSLALTLWPIPILVVADLIVCPRVLSPVGSATWWYTEFFYHFRETLLLNSVTCFLMYSKNALLDNRPSSMIV